MANDLAKLQRRFFFTLKLSALVLLISGATVLSACNSSSGTKPTTTGSTPTAPAAPPAAPQTPAPTAGSPAMENMEVAKAVMVTVEIDLGKNNPTIAEGLTQIERRYKPDDGAGRTFAILDAYGEPTPDGKLHMSMHVSSEKPGYAALVNKKTGEVLWQSTIRGSSVAGEKKLGIYVDNGAGGSFVVDGSNNPASVLDARVQGQPNKLVGDLWPDGAEREVTFIYSACGCPVKVMVKRIGAKTARTKDLPIMFPDDPAAVRMISALMRW